MMKCFESISESIIIEVLVSMYVNISQLGSKETIHTAYNWNIKCQTCAGMGLNGFIFKKIIKNYAENMKKIVGAV